MDMQITTIPRAVSNGDELVVLRRKDFDEFQQWNSQVKHALVKIHRGKREYQNGKTIVADSPKSFR